VSPATSRWLIAGLFLLTVPWPMPGPFDVFVPPIRYAMLATAAGAVGWSEGAAGTVPSLIGLLSAQAIGTFGLSFLLAWLLARLLTPVSARVRRACVLGVGGAWLLVCLFQDVYRTAFGDTATTNLLGVLFP
jgi:hypothetical protein